MCFLSQFSHFSKQHCSEQIYLIPIIFSASLTCSLISSSSSMHLSLCSDGIPLKSLERKSAKALSCFPFTPNFLYHWGRGAVVALFSELCFLQQSHPFTSLFHFIFYSSCNFCHFPLAVQSCFTLSHLPSKCPTYILLYRFTGWKIELLSFGSIQGQILAKCWLPRSFPTL